MQSVKVVLVLILFGSFSNRASANTPNELTLIPSLAAHEQQVRLSTRHMSEFGDVPRTTARAACEATQPPEALATPAPLIDQPAWAGKVTVTFIIGIDGRVYSPLILQSAGPSEDRVILKAINSWRYRPATCNGVPTEAEAKIGFSSR
jgi:TonB family protein